MDQTGMTCETMELSVLLYVLREMKYDEGGTTILS